jgi:hypothetical protein
MARKSVWLIAVVLLTMPHFLFAATSIQTLLTNTKGLLTVYLIPLAFASAFLFFLYGTARYIFSGADDAKANGRQLMVWGVIALFVVSAMWGIRTMLAYTFGFNSGSAGGQHGTPCIGSFSGGGNSTCADFL